jgi:hypothetical protein
MLYTLAQMGTSLVFLAPLLVTLALKVNSLVGIERAPASLGLVTGVASLLAMVSNPFFGKLSDRTALRLGMRRPWMIIGLVGGSLGVLTVALARSITVVLVGWCAAQLFFNALLAARVAVLPDKVPAVERGLVSGALGICVPIASVASLRQAVGADGLVAGQALVAFYDRMFVIGQGFIPAMNALLLGSLLYRSRLVPRVLPLLGLIGAPLLIANVAGMVFGLWDRVSAVTGILTIPIAVWEFSLGVYLIVKGSKPSPITADLTTTTTQPAYQGAAV